MNLLHGRIESEPSGLHFVHPALSIPINDRSRNELELHASNRDVVIGLRPQEIKVTNGSAGETAAELEVYTFEPLGKYEVITVSAADDRMKVKTLNNPFMLPGDKISLDLSDAEVFFFDPNNGRLLA